MKYIFKIFKRRLQLSNITLRQLLHLKFRPIINSLIITFIIALLFPLHSFAFALFAHETIIDMEWEKNIQPLLKIKYPKASDSALQLAHSYVYGGALIPDIGYYPMVSIFFTHLLHYVKTGDFVNALLDEAEDVNEYAFALGALCHYYADKYGHPLCTNHAVAMLFPELKQKFGNVIDFEQDETAHAQVEFGFDVLQTALGNYKPTAYHDYIGFQVSQPVLERAFLKTYKFEMNDIFKSVPIAIAVFRFTVKNIIPELTRDAWRIRQSIITKINPLADKDNYEYKIDKETYDKEFGTIPIESTFLSFLIWLFPKVGPFAVFNYKEPSPEVEKIYKSAIHTILIHYSGHLKKLAHSRPRLENINYDTGKKTVPKDYKLADETYEELVKKLRDK